MIPLARYWRLRFLENQGGANLGIVSMDFHNREDGPGFIAGGEALASHGDASGIFTGGDPWSTIFIPGETWCGYRFDSPVTPERVVVTAGGPDAPSAAVVEASLDGEVWYTIEDEITFYFPGGVT